MTWRRRDLKKEEFWRGMLRRQARSGLSVRAWCLKHRRQPSAFYWWRRELGRRDAEASEHEPVSATTVFRLAERSPTSPSSPAFVPVRMTEEGPTKCNPMMEIVLTNGRRIRLWGSTERSMLTEVLAVLEGPGC